jgi:hypothetical protein
MVALVDVLQVADRVQKVVDTALPALQSTLPPLEQAGREAIRRSLANAAATAQHSAATTMTVGSDVGLDLVIAKVDPTAGLDPKTFTVDGGKGAPAIKEDLAHLTHATTEKDHHDREYGRGSHQSFINPVPKQSFVPWASPEPPQMREGAGRQGRDPLMKF